MTTAYCVAIYIRHVFLPKNGEMPCKQDLNLMNQVKKEQRQVNTKLCELKRGTIGIVEKAQETRFGMSPKYSR